MRQFDHDMVPELLARLRAIPSDANPLWGRMTPPEMVAHLVVVVRYSMGRSGSLPVRSNWFVQRIVAPLVLNGFLKLPRNVRAPRAARTAGISNRHDDIETLQALLDEYLQLVQADELTCPPHPIFGDIGVDGWARFHMAHFEHHLRQFGA